MNTDTAVYESGGAELGGEVGGVGGVGDPQIRICSIIRRNPRWQIIINTTATCATTTC